jgi:hypothetical protein
MTKKVEICSNALILLGHKPISSLDEPGAGALLCKNLYESTYLDFLSSNNWNFAKKFVNMNRLSETPLNPNWQYQFQLPTDYVRLDGTVPVANYQIFEDKLYTNNQDIGLNYFYNIKEELLPAYAVRAMEYYMAFVLAVPLTVDANKASLYEAMYTKQSLRSMQIDAQGAPSEGFAINPIADVRFG